MHTHKKHLFLRIVLILLAAVILAAAGGVWYLFGGFIPPAMSVRAVDGDLYSMEFRGDYGLDQFLARGAVSDADLADYLTEFISRGFYKADRQTADAAYGCSAVLADRTGGGFLYGRNYDWERGSALIVHTVPDKGYESVSTCYLGFLGFGKEYRPDRGVMERLMALAAVYVPLDGMNEKGLMVADLVAGDRDTVHQQTGKTPVTTTTAIRLLLDRAANVEEALDLLSRYDMNSSAGMSHPFFLADAEGSSCTVEYIDGAMSVVPSRCLTNHYLTEGPKAGIGSAQSHLRFDTLAAFSGTADRPRLRDLLASVSQGNYPRSGDDYEITVWSIVYDPAAREAEFFFREDYSTPLLLKLGRKDWITKE